MKISVAIPTFQSELYIEATLQSIINQSQPPDEVIISDDSSTDRTISIINLVSKNTPFPIKIYNHIPSGITSNYLNAVKYTNGDIIILGDHDDVWVKDKIHKIVNEFYNYPNASLFCSDSMIVDECLVSSGRTLRSNIMNSNKLSSLVNSEKKLSVLYFLSGKIPLLAHTLAFRKGILPYVLDKPSDIDNWFFEEWLSCVAFSLGDIKLIPEALTLYRQHDKQFAGATKSQQNIVKSIKSLNKKIDYLNNRIQKLEYMLFLLNNYVDSSSQKSLKVSLIKEYIFYIKTRKQLIEPNQKLLPSLYSLQNLLLRGSYHDFSKGIWSFLADFYYLVNKHQNTE